MSLLKKMFGKALVRRCDNEQRNYHKRESGKNLVSM